MEGGKSGRDDIVMGDGAGDDSPWVDDMEDEKPNMVRLNFGSLKGMDVDDGVGAEDGADVTSGDERIDFGLEVVPEEPVPGENTHGRHAGLISSTFNLTNCIIGGGVLALPYAYSKTGLIVGVAMTFIIAWMGVVTANLLKRCVTIMDMPVKSFKDLGIYCYGVAGGTFIAFNIQVFLLGGITGYVVILADILTPFMLDILYSEDDDITEYDCNRVRFVTSLVQIALVVYPLCTLKYINALRYASYAAVGCIFYLVIVIAINSIMVVVDNHDDEFSDGDIDSSGGAIYLFPPDLEVFSAFPIITFAFSFHTAFFAIYNELKRQQQIDRVVSYSSFIAATLYLVVGVFGFCAFTDQVKDNILLNFGDNVFVTLGRLCLAIVISFSYPLLHFPLRESQVALYYSGSGGEKSIWDSCPMPLLNLLGKTKSVDATGPSDERQGLSTPQREDKIEEHDDVVNKEETNGTKVSTDSGAPTDSATMDVNATGDQQPQAIVPAIATSSDLPTGKRIAITTVNVLVSFILGTLFPNIGQVFGLVGATSGCVIVFIFPCLCFIKIFNDKGDTDPVIRYLLVMSKCITVVAVLLAVIGTVVILIYPGGEKTCLPPPSDDLSD